MSKKILIDAVYSGETRVVIYDKNRIQDFDYENRSKKQLKGNIYLAKITRVEPSLQAAFIEYGGDKHGFLPFNEIHPSYFILDSESGSVNEISGAALADKISAITFTEVNESEEVKAVVQVEASEASEQLIQESSVEEEQSNFIVAEENLEDDLEEREEAEYISHHNALHQKYKIQDVIKKGQLILIQIIKEERGNKGAACTSYISLAGRYCVLMPNSDKQGGISRRIINPNDRKRLKDVLSHLDLSDGVSIILRTAGADKNISDIRRDYYYLARLWNAIREHALASEASSFIHAESDLLKRTIRDLYSSEISEISIQGEEAYKSAKAFIKKILPLHAHKVREYRNKVPIFIRYNIEEQITSLYTPIAHLPSGGYIVINPTEALIAIDVNSGKATNEKNIEETATKTNVEAAVEVARQLKLRDLSGLIVIDFIDMVESSNRRLVERTLREAFQSDRSKIQSGNISAFGLLELSRQRLNSSFTEVNTIACPSCAGKGYIRNPDTNSLVILRTIEGEIYKGDSEVVNIYAHPDMILHLLNNMRDHITRLEATHKCKIILHKEDTSYYDGFAIEKISKLERSSSKSNDSPKFNDEEYIDSYQDNIAEGKEDQLTPYQVNDEAAMTEAVTSYNKANRNNNKFNRGFIGKKRKAFTPHKQNIETSDAQPVVQAQPVADDKEQPIQRKNNKRRGGRFKNYKSGNKNNNNDPKKSTIFSWWEKLMK